MTCTKCNQPKTIDDFFVDKQGKMRRPCRSCTKSRMDRHNASKKEENKLRYIREKDKRRNNVLLRTYGITQGEYTELLVAQNNLCALCFFPFDDMVKRPHIDHCHTTGKVRGIVHSQCNMLLGFAKDNTTLLQQAINYLQK